MYMSTRQKSPIVQSERPYKNKDGYESPYKLSPILSPGGSFYYLYSMAKTHFYLKEPKKKESLILLHIFLHGRRFRISTRENILTKYWNKKQEESKKHRDYPDYLSINASLYQWKLAANKSIAFWEQKGEVPTSIQIKSSVEEFRYDFENSNAQENTKIKDLLEKFIRQLESDSNIKDVSIGSYKQLLNNFELSGFPLKNLELNDLTLDVLTKFTTFLQKDMGYAFSNAQKHQRRLIRFLNWCRDNEISFSRAYESKSWRVQRSKPKRKHIALEAEEVRMIKEANLSGSEDIIRDIFIIGVYTGQRISDYKNITSDSVVMNSGKKYLEIYQKKTKTKISFPLPETVEQLIEKYDGQLPSFSEAYINRKIKDIGRKAGLEREVLVHEESSVKSSTRRVKVYKLITTHTARRTFATLAAAKGIPPYDIMHYTGHKDLKTFSNYIKHTSTAREKIDLGI